MSGQNISDIENRVYLGISKDTVYPTNAKGYSPKVEYPEYVFGSNNLSLENPVYDLVREGFYTLGYDKVNYGVKEWNPLGEFINEGDTVLIKPNWVMHYNKNKDHQDNMECLVTHPSTVRAVIDYTLIALKNTGRVIIADAPMQGCNLQEMFSKTGYLELFEFYKSEGIHLEIIDLRQCRVNTNKHIITETIAINGEDQSIQVELGQESAHLSDSNLRYKVSDYKADNTNQYHHDRIHTYNINKNVLLADVILNMPKPKCHRLAGLTAAQKNIVGITYDKACLPHRSIGAKISGGDEYQKRSIIKALITRIEEKKLGLTQNGKTFSAIILQFLIAILYVSVKVCSKDKVMIGSWYGNDTIWRTVSDLNFIVRYADKNGAIRDTPQRRILNIADMIIAGQGNGPVGPSPKNLGMILIGEDSSLIDAICAKIMGFNIEKVPGLNSTMRNNRLRVEGIKNIYSNNQKYNNVLFEDFLPDENWRFIPHDSWKDFIENY